MKGRTWPAALHLFVSHFIVCICGLCCFAPGAMLMHSVVRCYGQLVVDFDAAVFLSHNTRLLRTPPGRGAKDWGESCSCSAHQCHTYTIGSTDHNRSTNEGSLVPDAEPLATEAAQSPRVKRSVSSTWRPQGSAPDRFPRQCTGCMRHASAEVYCDHTKPRTPSWHAAPPSAAANVGAGTVLA